MLAVVRKAIFNPGANFALKRRYFFGPEERFSWGRFRPKIAKILRNPQEKGTLGVVMARLVASQLSWSGDRLFRAFEYSSISGCNPSREYKHPRSRGMGTPILDSQRCGRVQDWFLPANLYDRRPGRGRRGLHQ